MRTIGYTIIVIVAILAACTPVKRGSTQASKPADEPYDFKKEGTVPAVEAEDIREVADVEEVAIEESPLVIEEAEVPIDTTTPPPPRTMIEGFRIQLFATGAEDVANTAKYAAESRLGVEAHVELEDGLYKVRAGDCKSREEAEVLLSRCREGFYKDAWIVECQVFTKRHKPASQQE